jgi:hypothetical protein
MQRYYDPILALPALQAVHLEHGQEYGGYKAGNKNSNQQGGHWFNGTGQAI